jgi:hypothetical protein
MSASPRTTAVSKPRYLPLKLDVDEANIDCLESAPCEGGFATKEHEYQESYRTFQRSTSYPRGKATPPTATSR